MSFNSEAERKSFEDIVQKLHGHINPIPNTKAAKTLIQLVDFVERLQELAHDFKAISDEDKKEVRNAFQDAGLSLSKEDNLSDFESRKNALLNVLPSQKQSVALELIDILKENVSTSLDILLTEDKSNKSRDNK